MKKEDFYALIPKAEIKKLTKGKKLPAYFYFRQIIKKKHLELSSCLPDRFWIHYAFKANPNRDVINVMRSLGVGADVASWGELTAAREAGFSPEEVEFTGPGKTLEELSLAVDLGISSINVESVSEIKKIAGLCRTKGKTARVGIRVNPKTRPSASAMKMGGDAQFGIVENDLEDALAIIRSESKLLHFTGLHMHLGSQYMDADKILANYRFILEKAFEIAQRYAVEMEKVNFGGGWGIDMFGKKPPLDLAVIKDGLSNLFNDPKYNAVFGNTKFIVEPGRYLVAECGIYAVAIMYRKKGHQREFLIVDGGMHQHYAAAGGIGQVIRRNFEVDALLYGEPDNNVSPYSVVGSLCIPDDILATELELDSSISEGDVLLFFNSGAYGFSASPLHFLSHPLPKEVFI